MPRLTYGQIHLMKLAQREAGPDGWAFVSARLWEHCCVIYPDELVEKRPAEDGSGHVRLTDAGTMVLKWSTDQ
jgi:hypothetical protein